jgi:hypothetical protein
MVMSRYDSDIKEYWQSRMPEDIQLLANRARDDLSFGPVYLNKDDEICAPFDEGAVQFDFIVACRKIGEWCDENITPLYVEYWCGVLETEPPEDREAEYYCWDEFTQKEILFGELASYL